MQSGSHIRVEESGAARVFAFTRASPLLLLDLISILALVVSFIVARVPCTPRDPSAKSREVLC